MGQYRAKPPGGNMAKKALVLMKDEKTGCIVPVSHHLNHDGYFRKRINGSLVMYHRHIWEQTHGPVPEGYEVHHSCGNRACCNPTHLECLEGTEHVIQTNRERYAARKHQAKELWRSHHYTGTELASIFGVSISQACRWVRGWKV